MTAITGSNTNIGIKLGATTDTYGTALTTDTKLVVESVEWSENPETLQTNSIGSGKIMTNDIRRGNIAPSVSFEMIVGYQNGWEQMLAQMLGNASAPAEQTVGEGDYLHTIKLHTTTNRVFNTIAVESSSSTVIEFPSVTWQSLTFTAEDPANYVKFNIDGLANDLIETSTTNTNATLQGLSVPDTELTVVEQQDEFLINTQSGAALASPTDRINITSYTLTLNRPQDFRNEIKGASGNSTPIASGLIDGTLQITLAEHTDNTWETAAKAGNEYKCSFTIEGTQIGTGKNKAVTINIPRMVLIDTPQYSLSDAGTNPTTLTFVILAAASNPTGMSDVYPYFELINTKSTAYIS